MDQLKNCPVVLDQFWCFARGDLDTASFEKWLYASDEAERALGAHAYLDAICLNLRDTGKVREYRGWLRDYLPGLAACECHTTADYESVILGHWTSQNMDFLEPENGLPAWLHRAVCKTYATLWTFVEEGLIYDTLIVVRGSVADIPEARSFRGLLSLAIRSGASVHYLAPMQSRELPMAIEQLATESPGISLTELTALLPVDRHIVRHHALDVLSRTDLNIDLQD